MLNQLPAVVFNKQIYFWVYLQNIASSFKWPYAGPNHFWSLAIEEHFYLIWPLLIFYMDTKKVRSLIFFLIAVGFVSRGIFYSLGNASGVVTFTLSTADQLGIGALLAVMEAEGKLENINPNKFLGLLLMILVAGGLLQLSSTGLLSAANEVSKHFFFAFCYFCLIGYILTISQNHWLKRVLKSGFLTYTGKISYGLYVFILYVLYY